MQFATVMRTVESILLLLITVSAHSVASELPPSVPGLLAEFNQPLRPRVHRLPPAYTVIKPWMSSDRLVLKFAEGSGVRMRNGRLISLAGKELAEVNHVLARSGIIGSRIRPLIDRPERLLAQEKVAGEMRSGKQLADLSLYYLLELRRSVNSAQVADDLNSLAIVESAFPQELPAPPPAVNPDTPNFAYMQGYKNQLAGGVGIDAVAGIPGVDGTDITVADIEYDWVLDHEDLMLPESTNTDPETIYNPWPPANHGTAVLGMLVAKDNGFGITGIVPAAIARVFPTTTDKFKYNPGRAINRAAAALQPGDVMLLEIQTWVCGTDEYGPAEWSPVVFDVVENATALGIVVVAPAGNGNLDLDQPSCNGLFDRAVRDSGAIIVGAGEAGSNNKTSFSSYGARVDVQAWGDWSVTTTGYGALYDPLAGDLRRMYTNTFSGTSSASPIVAGAAVAVQGALRASADEPLDSYAMRTLLLQTGTPQGVGPYTGHIGPLPNVPAALASLYLWYSIDVSPQDDINYIDTALPGESVSVALLAGSAEEGVPENFDIDQVDHSTVRFGPGQALPIAPIIYADINGDGKSDAEILFEVGESGIACEDTSATLTAETYMGFTVQGTDRIETPVCPDSGCHP